jgi:hypothetical protein
MPTSLFAMKTACNRWLQDRRPSRRVVRALLALMVIAAVASASFPARAQESEGSDEAFDMGMSMLSRRGIEKYASILHLDDDQKQAAQALFDGYIEAMRDMGKDLQASMKAMQEKMTETQDYSAYQKEMGPKMKEFQERSERLQNGFFDDLKSFLTEAQAARWPRLERYRLREELMQMGMVSGSGVDLTMVADKLKIDPESSPALAEQFDRYEMEVDKPLQALKAAAKEMQDDAYDNMADFDPAHPEAMMERYKKMMERLMVPARQVRDLNRQYERLIVPLLPAETASKFESEFNLRSFPRVYRKSHAAKALAAAEKFSDLTEDQRENLANIRAAYERDLAPANAKWAAEIETQENADGGAFMQMAMSGMGGGDPNDPVAQARKARRELDDQTRERIVAALNEDQRSRLPEKGSTADNPWEDFQPVTDEDSDDEGQ